jgi:hypothetical protein
MNEIEKIKAKIKKLLALSQSPNPNEAAIALEMAQKLMVEYNVAQFDINNIDIIEESTPTTNRKNPPLYEVLLVKKIQDAFGCDSLYVTKRNNCFWRFIGLRHRAEIAAYICQILIRKLKSARVEYIKTLYRVRSKYRKTQRADDFCFSWVYTVTKKLPKFAGINENEKNTIADYVNKCITTTEEIKAINRSLGNTEDYLNGRRAAEGVQLQHSLTGNSQEFLLLRD